MRLPHAVALGVAALSLVACTDGTEGGLAPAAEPLATEVSPAGVAPLAASAAKFWETGASVGWSAITQELILRNRSNPADAARLFSYVSAAQYEAVLAADAGRQGRMHPSARAAAAAAAARVLAYQYPNETAAIEALVAEQRAAEPWPGEQNRDPAAGDAIGRAVGARFVERARTDGFADATQVPPPVGPQFWFRILSPFNPPPYKPLLGTNARPWFLTSGAQFRAAPHPAFGSPAFLAALDEVRSIAANRTPAQDSIARLWDATVPASTVGPITPMGFWNGRARDLIVRHRLNERRAAEMLATMNMAGWDAFIGCWDSKYHYWLARPHMVDPTVQWVTWLPFVPPHPSYPSGHSCMSSAATRVLSEFFPSERQALEAEREEASESRIYGGIHYRFDVEAGDALGRQVAAWVLSQAAHGSAGVALAK